MNTKVPFFNYPHLFESQKEDFLKIICDVGSRGAFIMQKDLIEFEQNIASYSGANYAVGVANATDVLERLLHLSGIAEGDEVVFCSHTMVAIYDMLDIYIYDAYTNCSDCNLVR